MKKTIPSLPWFAWLCGAALAMAASPGMAATRALLVGIDRYTEPGPRLGTNETRVMWTDLDGAVNDVVAVRELLITRMGFQPDSIIVLTNGAATRSAILSAYEHHLRDPAAAGDDVLFYYSGHGSQVVNSLSTEPDRKDETIVPADSNRGAEDIRDKEMRRLHNAVLERGARLTVVLDSCHSGSAARGLAREGKTRFLAPDLRDVADDSPAGPAPEERGALVMSAAQDFQLAREDIEESGGLEVKHGAFSLALIRALRCASPGTPAEELFLRARAQIKGRGWAQEPVLAGSPERRRAPLFGSAAANASATLRVPVLRVDPDARVVLQGGMASGLGPGCELSTDSTSGRVVLVVEQLDGADKSVARVQSGAADRLQAGDVLTLTRWAPREEALLRVWLPHGGPSSDDLSAQAAQVGLLRGHQDLRWIEDPTRETPEAVVFWDEGAWWFRRDAAPPVSLGRVWAADDVAAKVGSGSLFVAWPLPGPAARELGDLLGRRGVALSPRGSATYWMVGRWQDGAISYAWVRPEVSAANTQDSALPARTDWQAGRDSELAASLGAGAGKLARVCGWLLMNTPPDSGAFPYRLAVRRVGDGAVRRDGVFREREVYELVLTTDRQPGQGPIEQRYVYVFYIDSAGASTLLFPPPAAGNVENRVPIEKKDIPPVLELGKGVINGFEIAPPFGVDTCLLLTSVEPLPDPSVLEFDGVLTRGENGSPLELLCGQLAGATRGPRLRVSTPVTWSLDRLTFRTEPAEGSP